MLTEDSLHEISDSQFCIEFLSKRYNVNLNEHLNNEQLAISRAFFKMAEESLNWLLFHFFLIYHELSNL